MTLKKISKKQHKLIMEERRRMVASLYLRGVKQQAIAVALANDKRDINGKIKPGRVNPESGEPWSVGTINSDIKALSKQWRQEALESVDSLFSRQLAENREARAQAWRDKDMAKVFKGLDQEIALTGTSAPLKQDITTGGEPLDKVLEKAIGKIYGG